MPKEICPKLGEVLPKEICPEKRKRETIFWCAKVTSGAELGWCMIRLSTVVLSDRMTVKFPISIFLSLFKDVAFTSKKFEITLSSQSTNPKK